MRNMTIGRLCGHTVIMMIVCLFVINLSYANPRNKKKQQTDNKIYLIHADKLSYDIYGNNPQAQVLNGNVIFKHQGATLWCDSAYLFQESNSFNAFGHVKMKQGDTLTLTCARAFYNGQTQMVEAREKVVLVHRKRILRTDSLNYDRLYDNAYFFEGGTLIDGKDKLVSDWGEYNTGTKQAAFYYHVQMHSGDRIIDTDTLFYNTTNSEAHLVGKSLIRSKDGTIKTTDGYFDTKSGTSRLFGRSVIDNGEKHITGDSLYKDDATGIYKGFGNVILDDKKNKNSLYADEVFYNEKEGKGFATKNAMAVEYSKGDTLFMHADSIKLYTFNIGTDSIYRETHCFDKVKTYRKDVQSICDSLVFNSKDSCLTLYKNPIVWSDNRQLSGEMIKVYLQDTTVRESRILGQALSIEQLPDKEHYNQISSNDMYSYFNKGKLKKNVAVSNVKAIYYYKEEKDTVLVGLNYTETDTIKMYINDDRSLDKIWMPKAENVLYPISQIPPDKYKLPEFRWIQDLRPMSKADLFVVKELGDDRKIEQQLRPAPPVQKLRKRAQTSEDGQADGQSVEINGQNKNFSTEKKGKENKSQSLPADTIKSDNPDQTIKTSKSQTATDKSKQGDIKSDVTKKDSLSHQKNTGNPLKEKDINAPKNDVKPISAKPISQLPAKDKPVQDAMNDKKVSDHQDTVKVQKTMPTNTKNK